MHLLQLPYIRRRTISMLAVLALIFTLLAPLSASAIDNTQLENVPLPSLDGEFQNTDGSSYPPQFGQNNGGGNEVTSQRTVAQETPAPTGTRPPVTQPMLQMEPHCTETDRTTCPFFAVADPTTLTTGPLNLGDILDIDVVVASPNPIQIATVRGWLQYDPTALEARVVELTPSFPQPIPGEQEIDKSRGLVKIGAGAPPGSIATQETPVARVSFRVINGQQNTTIRFADYTADGAGSTAILDVSNAQLLSTEPSALEVVVGADDQTGGSQQSSLPYTPPPSSQNGDMPGGGTENPADPSTGNVNFSVLQVQGVRVTSQGDSLFIGWIPLQTQALAGYNVYYGTVSGRYIQRRSLAATENSLVIRGLETGVQYFVAVRGFSADTSETAFSEEASVVIGRPETSTSPLSQQSIDTPSVDGNPIDTRGGTQVVGDTGIGDAVTAFLIAAAMIGTALAWRRQFTFQEASHDG